MKGLVGMLVIVVFILSGGKPLSFCSNKSVINQFTWATLHNKKGRSLLPKVEVYLLGIKIDIPLTFFLQKSN